MKPYIKTFNVLKPHYDTTFASGLFQILIWEIVCRWVDEKIKLH